MTPKNNAFPLATSNANLVDLSFNGLTKREVVAIEFAKQLLVQKDLMWGYHDDLIPLSLRYADEFILQLTKTEK